MAANGLIQQRLRVNLLSIQLPQELEFPSNLRPENPFSQEENSLIQSGKELRRMEHYLVPVAVSKASLFIQHFSATNKTIIKR